MEENYLNIPQAKSILIDPQIAVLIYGRRLGKSSEIFAHLTIKRIFDMPGASFLILGKSYKQLLERTLAATKTGWAKRGYIEDVHYVIGKKPPKNWAKSKILPSDWSHTVSWFNGSTFNLGSQDREGLVNSLTCHGLFGDEAKMFDEKRFKEDALPVVSAPKSMFPDSPHNRSIILATSMPKLPEGQWLFDYEKLQDKKQINLILALAVKIELLKNKFRAANTDLSRATYISQIRILEDKLRLLRLGGGKGCVFFDEASTLANVHIMGWDYIFQQKEILKDKFASEILNLRPKNINGFYSKLNEKHWISLIKYTIYDDNIFSKSQQNCLIDNYSLNEPLSIGMDFGANINCIVTAQKRDFDKTILILKEHFVKSPLIQDDVVRNWCEYYRFHKEKTVRFWYDNTGNNRTGNSYLTKAGQAKKIMEENGWIVHLMTNGGSNIAHHLKHSVINTSLDEKQSNTYKIRINEPNCECLKESMQYASAIESGGEIKKDKSSERSKSIPQEYATHLSDAFDSLVFGESLSKFNGSEHQFKTYDMFFKELNKEA